jgi:hypothetical protein
LIELHPTRSADLPALSLLFERCFGHGLSPAEWGWKYQQAPGRAASWSARAPDGAVVAHAGALGLPARWQGREVLAWSLVDFAGTTVGGGLRSTLVDLGRRLLAELPGPEDLPWIFGFPSARHFRLGQRTFGYRPLARWHQLEGEIPALEGRGEVELEISDRLRGDWAEELAARLAPHGVRRTAAFLNWRYCARPERYYRFYRLGPAAAPEGLAVFGFHGRTARAAELWLGPELERAAAFAALAADLREVGLERWSFWPPPTSQPTLLDGLGLDPAEEVFCGYRSRLGAPDPAPTGSGFHYAQGDWDVV